MTKIEARNEFAHYLKSYFSCSCEKVYVYENIKQLTMVYTGYSNCPNSIIESCIYFHEECMECRVYYTKLSSDICKNSAYQAELFRLLNYINATVWPRFCEGYAGDLYESDYLHTSRIYVTEDDCYDITATTIIPYIFYDDTPIVTGEYMTACIPELMDKLSPAIFGLLTGKITIEDAMKYVKTNILNEEY